MQSKKTWTFAVAAALVVSAAPLAARAADPLKSGPQGKQMTREQQLDEDKRLYKDFQRQREELKRTGHKTVANPWLRRRAIIQVKPHDVDMRIEKFADGAILYSVPVDPKTEALLYRGQKFRKVESKGQISDHVVYDNRVYRVMAVTGSWPDWQNAVGREAIVTMQTKGGMQQALSVRVKK